ncbi:MAG: SpoVG family protein [Planctomycetales bacterium]
MEITEVRIKLMEDPQERLQAFCSITFDSCFVIRDLKIIEGTKGSFVAMPSRKLMDRCPHCGMKNHLRSVHCNQCGSHLPESRASKDYEGRAKLYADIAHPINSRCREMIQNHVLKAYQEELQKAKQPGYICSYDDYGEDSYADILDFEDARNTAQHVDQVTHRLDSQASPPNPPHIAQGRELRDETTRVRSGENEDNFGSGIL